MSSRTILVIILSVPMLFCEDLTMALTMTSSAFAHNAHIPAQYTCNDLNISPQLQWQDIPQGARSLVLIMDDPDAPMGVWDHWILFNIPPDITELSESISQLPEGTKVGKNSWGRTDYGGPCPPSGEHRYYFKLYALDITLDLPKGTSKIEVVQAMQGHILAETHLIGRYTKST